MTLWDRLFRGNAERGEAMPMPQSAPRMGRVVQASTFGMNSAQMLEFIRTGAGAAEKWEANSAAFRCVTLIGNAVGQLPFNLNRIDDAGVPVGKADTHAVHRLLRRRPNHFQTPMVFKRAMTMQALQRGNAYALPIRLNGRVTELIPFPPGTVRTESDGLSVVHIATTKKGEVRYGPGEILHLMGPSEDGIKGLSMMEAAKDTLALWRDNVDAQRAANANTARPGGALEFPQGHTLSDEAFAHLRASLQEEHAGPENSGKFMILEDGAKANLFDYNLDDLKSVEARNQQVEDIARIYGVPRPFLMLDDTSWGTGIEQLAIFFVTYALAPWFVSWEQAVTLSLLTEKESETLQPKFNEKALLRGSAKDQGEWLGKLIGGTQAPGILSPNEARAILEMGPSADPGADKLYGPAPSAAGGKGA